MALVDWLDIQVTPQECLRAHWARNLTTFHKPNTAHNLLWTSGTARASSKISTVPLSLPYHWSPTFLLTIARWLRLYQKEIGLVAGLVSCQLTACPLMLVSTCMMQPETLAYIMHFMWLFSMPLSANFWEECFPASEDAFSRRMRILGF